MGEATTVVSFPNDSDQAFRKAILKASAKLYGSNTDMVLADLLSVQITLMVDVLWNSFKGIVLDPSPSYFKAFLNSAAEIVTTGQHIVDDPAKATTPGTDAVREVGRG